MNPTVGLIKTGDKRVSQRRTCERREGERTVRAKEEREKGRLESQEMMGTTWEAATD